jgi:RNA polymerase sigma factor (sigma-70 family)
MVKQGKAFKIDWDTFVLDGDAASFYNLYAHYHDYLTFIALKRGAGAEKTKDCINDLFLYVYENREKLGHIQNHHNYLITSFLRKLFRKEHFSAEESQDLFSLQQTPTDPSVEVEYIRQHTSEHLTAVLKMYINKLSESQSKMIYQKFYLGLSYEEISVANDITVKTAYNTIYNAVEKLKQLIGKEHLGTLAIAISLLSLFLLIFFENL